MSRLKLFLPLGILGLLLALFYVGLKLDPSAMPSVLVGKPVPDFRLSLVRDEQTYVNQDYFKDKVSLLNIWATWCYACRIEHPYFNKLADEGIHIVGVNYKDEREAAQKWLRDLHDPYVFSLYDQSGRLGLDLGVTGAPETYLVDKQGIIRYRHIGVVDTNVWESTLGPQYQALLTE